MKIRAVLSNSIQLLELENVFLSGRTPIGRKRIFKWTDPDRETPIGHKWTDPDRDLTY
jgi:hypothetical protein